MYLFILKVAVELQIHDTNNIIRMYNRSKITIVEKRNDKTIVFSKILNLMLFMMISEKKVIISNML